MHQSINQFILGSMAHRRTGTYTQYDNMKQTERVRKTIVQYWMHVAASCFYY